MAELEFGLGQSKTVICGMWIWSGLGGLGFCLYGVFLAVQEGAGGMHDDILQQLDFYVLIDYHLY